MKQMQEGLCVTNSFGRLLEANKKFCSMIGIKSEDVPWRYILDYHRRESDWLRFREHMERHGQATGYLVRLRHRNGRSFQCLVQSVRHFENGLVRYRTRIQKVANMEPVMGTGSSSGHKSGSVVYMTACHACGKVKDAEGHWLDPERPVVPAAHRKACYCPDCTARLFPGILDPQNWEPVSAIGH